MDEEERIGLKNQKEIDSREKRTAEDVKTCTGEGPLSFCVLFNKKNVRSTYTQAAAAAEAEN